MINKIISNDVYSYYFKSLDQSEVKVEYTFAYIKDSSGNIKIDLHHYYRTVPRQRCCPAMITTALS